MTPTEALQETLALEHATLYAYGVLGARTSASADPALFDAVTRAFRQHRARRDRLRTMITDAGAEPVPAAVAYEPPTLARGGEAVRIAALDLEEASAQSLAALVAQTSADVRRWAAAELVWCASWKIELGGLPLTWPGAPELTT